MRNFVDKSIWNAQLQVNNVNVTAVGEVNSMFAAIGGLPGAPVYGSQDDLGKILRLSEPEAASFSLTSTGTLFGGLYQLVQVDSGATAANIFTGAAAYFLDTATGGGANSGSAGYVVTDSAHALSVNLFAGVFLNAITPGNFGFIQIGGKATAKYTAAVTDATVGDIVVAAGATAGTFDAIAAATAVTDAVLAKWVGIAIQLPVNASLKTIQLNGIKWRY